MTGRVLCIHGSVDGVDRRQFAFRNFTDSRALTTLLESVPPFVSLADAVAGRGDALTVDDATRGARDATLLARRLGHQVSLFVNPGQVQSGEPYWFAVLNAALDDIAERDVEFQGSTWPVATFSEKLALREAVKAGLRSCRDETERIGMVRALAIAWCGRTPATPDHFSTLTRHDLLTLFSAGVDLQNHGWSHADHSVLTANDQARDVHEGREWLEREIGAHAEYFAVPFGNVRPPAGIDARCTIWFTVDADFPPGPLDPGVFNRVEVDPAPRHDTRAERPDGWAARIRRLFRG